MSNSEANHCLICKTPFDSHLHRDCGGDCLLCMAEAGDHDCMEEAFAILKRQRDELLEALQRIASYPKTHGGELIAESMCDIAYTAIANTMGEAA